MDEDGMVDLLRTVLEGSEVDDFGVNRTRTFADAGLLTMDKGLVVRMQDGSEFEVTVVQRHGARVL